MKKTTILLFLTLTMAYTYAQQENTEKKSCKVTSFNIHFGGSGVFVPNTSSDYIHLKNSVDNPGLFVDPNEYTNSAFFVGVGGNAAPKISIGITPYSKKHGKYRNNRELRFGLGTNFGVRRSYSFYKNESHVIDTYQSDNGNTEVYADSMVFKNYYYQENIFDLNFSVSYLFKTDVDKRVHLYAGITGEYGIALRNYVSVDAYESHSIVYYPKGEKPDYDNDEYYPYMYKSDNYTSTTTKTDFNNTSHFLRASIPLGINFRFSNKHSFWKHMNIYSEFNPGVEFQIVAKDKTYVNPYFGFAFVGFSYKW